MKKSLFSFKICSCLIIIAFILPSCIHYYYGPNSNNVPVFKKKDEGRISAAISGADETTGFELQSAYAFGKNFAGMFNFYATGGKTESSSSSSGSNSASNNERGNGTLTEIAFGYFKPISTQNLVFEFYGGIGGGTVNNFYEQNESSKVGLTKFFIQPSLGYSNKAGTVEAAFSTRLSSIKFKVKEAKFTTSSDSYNRDQIRDIGNNDNIVFFEPSIMFRGGGKNVKVQLQLTSSHPLKQKEFLTQGLNTSLGILFSIDGKVKK